MCAQNTYFFSIVNNAIDIEIIAGKHSGIEQVITKKVRRGKKARPAKKFPLLETYEMEFNFQCLLCYKRGFGDAALGSGVREINLQLFFKSQRHVIAP